MKRKLFLTALISALLLSGCGNSNTTEAPVQQTEQAAAKQDASENAAVATKDDMVEPDAVGYEGMQSIYADEINDGTYNINVDSSSSMFKITECTLTAANGGLTAKMTMGGTGYEYLYLGSAEEAAAADENGFIGYTEENGVHSFEIPVEALDTEIACAAFSKKKQMWYDRTLVFRADSLPYTAFKNIVTADTLGLSDGEYTVNVTLSGGSGKAGVQSPAKLTVNGGKATAELIWSSNKYDYMVVDGEKILPTSIEEFSVFEIPVFVFDQNMPVKADTTAMSRPYEIDYTLNFESASITQ